MLVVLTIELLYHELNKNVSFTQTKSLIKLGKHFLPYFSEWFRKFHQNRELSLLTNVLGESTSRFEVDARVRV